MQEFKDLIAYCNILNSAFRYLNSLDKWKFISGTMDNKLTHLYCKFVSAATFELRRNNL